MAELRGRNRFKTKAGSRSRSWRACTATVGRPEGLTFQMETNYLSWRYRQKTLNNMLLVTSACTRDRKFTVGTPHAISFLYVSYAHIQSEQADGRGHLFAGGDHSFQ